MNTQMDKMTPPPGSPIRPVHPEIEGYITELLARHDETVLLEMEELARKQNFPIIGRICGSFLEVMALSIGARRVFEFGSGFGYSAYWFTRAVGPNGKVVCTEGDAENVRMAQDYLKRTGRWERTDYHTGWAQKVFASTQGEFDLIYNDADKGDYPEIWEMAKTRLRPGGLYICDNTLWSGRVARLTGGAPDVKPGWTEAIREHNSRIAQDRAFDFFFNPSRDGVIVARRR